MLVELFLAAIISVFSQTQSFRSKDKKTVLFLLLSYYPQILVRHSLVSFSERWKVQSMRTWCKCCDDLWQYHLLHLIYRPASKRKHHDSCKSIHDKHPPTLLHTSGISHIDTSIKLIFSQRTGFISETCGVLLTNADFHVPLIHFHCYSSWRSSPVIVIPQGSENDISLTNAIYPSANQPGEIMESNVPLPL